MANMQMEKTPMPEQDPKVRAHNFEEVSQGYTAEMAINEAKRCLNCKHKPCVSGAGQCADSGFYCQNGRRAILLALMK